MLLPISADAQKKSYQIGGASCVLALVGVVTTETVAIEIPAVHHPDEAVDAHWTALVQDGVAVVLDATANAILLEGNLLVRLNKSAGAAANAYGVRVG